MENDFQDKELKDATSRYAITVFITMLIISAGLSLLLNVVFNISSNPVEESVMEQLKATKMKGNVIIILDSLCLILACKFTLDSLKKRYDISQIRDKLFRNILIFLVIVAAVLIILKVEDMNKVIEKEQKLLEISKLYRIADYKTTEGETLNEVVDDIVDYCENYRIFYTAAIGASTFICIVFTKRSIDQT